MYLITHKYVDNDIFTYLENIFAYGHIYMFIHCQNIDASAETKSVDISLMQKLAQNLLFMLKVDPIF